ncbi:MAG: aminoacyl-tRNA hydrolase [Candidatus Buchananbacteria bacterium]
MHLIIGLGNPGKTYNHTKHNLGFWAVEKLAKELAASTWRKNTKFQAELAESKVTGEKIILAKPQTYMNLSGQAVQKITNFYKIKPADLIIIHDDFDLTQGRFKISLNASAAGHNGVASIIKELGTQNFIRLRLGIKNPEQKNKAENIVLSKLTADEKKQLTKLWPNLLNAINLILAGELAQASNLYNQR